MLITTVKISNVTNLSDARYCAGMGVDMLGFSVDEEAPNYITSKKFNEIRSWIAGVKIIAESATNDPAILLEKLEEYPVDALQVEDPGQLAYLRSETNLPLLLRINVDNYNTDDLEAILSRYGSDADFFILESDADQPLNENWLTTLKKISTEYPILLGFGIENDQNIKSLLEKIKLQGFSLRGSEEIRPGFKDFGSLMDILETLEEE